MGKPNLDDTSLREWCLDNASNFHVTSDPRYFIEYKVFLDDAQTQSVRGFQSKFLTKPIGRGTVQILVQNPKGSGYNIITLYDVLYVPDSMNLISHTQAEDQGFSVEYRSRKGVKLYELRQNKEAILEIRRDGCGLFTFKARNNFQPAMSGTGESGDCETLIMKETAQPQVYHTHAKGHAALTLARKTRPHQSSICEDYGRSQASRRSVTQQKGLR